MKRAGSPSDSFQVLSGQRRKLPKPPDIPSTTQKRTHEAIKLKESAPGPLKRSDMKKEVWDALLGRLDGNVTMSPGGDSISASAGRRNRFKTVAVFVELTNEMPFEIGRDLAAYGNAETFWAALRKNRENVSTELLAGGQVA